MRARADTSTAAPLIPARPTLQRLREAAKTCRACPLWKTGTQTVFGEGSEDVADVIYHAREPVASPS